jgi:hypothetical protein
MITQRPIVRLLTRLFLAFGAGYGCSHAPPRPLPPPPIVQPPPVEQEDLRSKVMGTWEKTERTGKPGRLVFQEDGTLLFQGALEFYNPARWMLDEAQKELKISFTQTPDEKLRIFQTYVGHEIKAFDREAKQVTYAFDRDTTQLVIAGWIYIKPIQAAQPMAPQPELP